METPLAYALISTLIVSIVSLIGVFFFSRQERLLRKVMSLFIGLAAGALLGDAFIHLIPEALESGLSGPLFALAVLTGIITFFIIEKYLHWHGKNHQHQVCLPGETCEVENKKPLGALILVGDATHNFVDGVIIAASYAISIPLGIATTVAVFLHEVPQEMSDFALLLHSQYSRAEALLWNFASALMAFAGVFAYVALGDILHESEPLLAAFTAGGFIYIAAVNLVPEIQKTEHPLSSAMEFVAVLVGIGIMFALLLVEIH